MGENELPYKQTIHSTKSYIVWVVMNHVMLQNMLQKS